MKIKYNLLTAIIFGLTLHTTLTASVIEMFDYKANETEVKNKRDILRENGNPFTEIKNATSNKIVVTFTYESSSNNIVRFPSNYSRTSQEMHLRLNTNPTFFYISDEVAIPFQHTAFLKLNLHSNDEFSIIKIMEKEKGHSTVSSLDWWDNPVHHLVFAEIGSITYSSLTKTGFINLTKK